MANLNKLFIKYNTNISLTSKEKERIKKGRDALRNKITSEFNLKNRSTPKFCTQGSFIMGTTIVPAEGEEYDLDNGVYIKGYSDDMSTWPSTQNIHKWITDAVDGHTDTPALDKNTCVRVIYKADYHIDLPSYIIRNEVQADETEITVAYLAHKANGWVVSDPRAFTRWFKEKIKENDEQLRRVVKYLKGWKEYKGIDLKGIVITILVGNHFEGEVNRDDIALLNTVTNIIDEIEDDFVCYKPVTPMDEDLFDGTSETKKSTIINGLNMLKKKLDKAINEIKNEKDAASELIKILGDSFPEGEDIVRDNMEYAITAAPTTLNKENHHFA